MFSFTQERLDDIQKTGFTYDVTWKDDCVVSARFESPDNALVIAMAYGYVVVHPDGEKPHAYNFKKNPHMAAQLVTTLVNAWVVNSEKC